MIRKYHQHTLTALSLLTLSVCQFAYAAETDTSITAKPNIDVNYAATDTRTTGQSGMAQAGTETQVYTTPVEISLYQLALQSGMTVDALRKLNNGTVDKIEKLPAMQSILLPKHSALFADVKQEEVSAISTLPELGGKGDAEQTTAQLLLEKTPVGSYVTGTTEENVASITQSAASQDWKNLTSDKIKDDAQAWAKSTAKQAIMEPIQKTANAILGRFGKGSVNISVDEHGSLKGSTLSVLSPLYDKDESLIFSQVGVHNQNGDRTVGNFGLGYRYEQERYLLGGNVFIDHDFTGNNTRLGLGTELWMDYLKLAANYYMPLSDWKDSNVILDFEERPAKGFDVRAQGYLPSYPQLGGSLKYEQYFGDDVALFGDTRESLQKDPKAISVGIDYTPIPLLTFKAEQRFGNEGKTDSRFDMNLNLQLGTDLDKQLDPANVAAMRTLKGSRYDLVDRNYDIVFEYRQKAFQVSFNLPTPYTLDIGQPLHLQLQTTSKTPIRTVKWSVKTKFGVEVTEGLDTQDLNNNDLSLTFKPRDIDTYIIVATVTNEAGITVTSAPFILNMRLAGGSLTAPRIAFIQAEVGANPYPSKPLPSFFAADYTDSQKLDMALKAVKYDENGQNEHAVTIPNAQWWIQVSQGNTVYVNTLDPDKKSGTLDGIALVVDEALPEDQAENGRRYSLVSAIDFGLEPVTVKIGYGVVDGASIPAVERQVYFHTVDPNSLVLQMFERGQNGQSKPVPMSDITNFKTDTYYEVVVMDKSTGQNVTPQFASGIRWHYLDGADTIDMEACQGYTMFSTQTDDFKNNEFSWGSLLRNPIDTEQGLLLVPSIDPSNWNPHGILNASIGPERGLVGTEYHGNVYCPDNGDGQFNQLNAQQGFADDATYEYIYVFK